MGFEEVSKELGKKTNFDILLMKNSQPLKLEDTQVFMDLEEFMNCQEPIVLEELLLEAQ